MKAGDLIIKTHVDNSDLDKGLKETEKKVKDTAKKKQLAEYKESLEYWKKRKEIETKLLKENEKTERSTYIQTRQKNISQAEEFIKLYENRIKTITEEKEETNEILESVSKISSNVGKTSSKLKGLGKTVLSLIGGFAKILANIIAISILIGGLMTGVAILSAGFKKAFENEQVKANLDYIKFAITKALEPALNRIVDIIIKIINLLFRIMQYVQFIIYQWTGKNIFENASVEAYAASLKKAEKNAKALKNQITSFDEMEVLQDNSSSASDTTGGIPNFDLSQMTMTPDEAPGWLRWIVDNKDGILSTLAGILGYVLLTKLGLKDIKALGIVLLIEGVIGAVKELKAYLEDPTWEHFGKMIEYIGLAVLGLGLIIGNLPLIIAGVIIAIFGLIITHWEEIKKWIDDNIFKWLDKKIKKYREKGYWGNVLADILTGIKYMIYEIIRSFDGMFNGIREIADGVILLFKGKIGDGLVKIFKGSLNTMIGLINAFISFVNTVLEPLRWAIDAGGELFGIKNAGTRVRIPLIPRLRKGTILNNPGKGVPVASGRAIAGEGGREAYLPLSDEQLLEELGSSIGRHVTINLTNITQMNGRILNRELKRVQNDQDFAFNG